MVRQCKLLEVNRSSAYYCPKVLSAGGGKELTDAVEELKFLEVVEQKRNIFIS